MSREPAGPPKAAPPKAAPRKAAPDDDATVRLPRRRVYGRPPTENLILANIGVPPIVRGIAIVVVMVIGVVGWFLMWEPAPPPPATLAPPHATAAQQFAIRTADEATILAHRHPSAGGETVAIFRFAPNPRVLVLDFATLLEQGRMLNRVAALTEKNGLPRDRVLGDAELDAAISAAGDTMETYYFGHDYAAADLVRFFALADRDGVRLRPEEERLRALLAQEGWRDAGATGALISLPQIGSSPDVDAALRATIMRHELSHAEFFSNPAYADFARWFWRVGLDDGGRAAFRRYLAAQNYDPTLEDLTVNEMQAYLMHTGDTRLFNAAILGVPPERLAQWQAAFLLAMPAGWLRDCTAPVGLPAAGTAPRPRRRPSGSKQGSSSFLKKRTKKLLYVSLRAPQYAAN